MENSRRELGQQLFGSLLAQRDAAELVGFEELRSELSGRRLWRLQLKDGSSVVGVVGVCSAEDRAFLGFTEAFRAGGLPVPKLLAASGESGAYLLEDLGDQTLSSELAELDDAGNSERRQALLSEAVATLVSFQLQAGALMDRSLCYQGEEFDEQAWRADQELFVLHFASRFADNARIAVLEEDLERLISLLSPYPRRLFLYRDYQPRNLMLTPRGLIALDYQAGRIGHPAWDIASLLLSRSSGIEPGRWPELLGQHEAALAFGGVAVEELRLAEAFGPYGLLRCLQSLGAVGRAEMRGRGGSLAAAGVERTLAGALALYEYSPALKALGDLRQFIEKMLESRPWQASQGQGR